MTPEQRDQISECKQLRNEGGTPQDCLDKGYAYMCVAIAFGRDPENLCEYGANNGPVKSRAEILTEMTRADQEDGLL